MKKMPCLFVREFQGPRSFTITEQVTPGCEWVVEGHGVASIKYDGTACLVRDRQLFKRYDYKKKARDKGRQPPEGWEACEEAPDEVTGHWPGWVPVGDEPESKWHAQAWARLPAANPIEDDTYELCGPHFSANPEGFADDRFVRHGLYEVRRPPLTFSGLRDLLSQLPHEGLVFRDGDKFAKIRRGDFGLAWPIKTDDG